MEKGEHIKIALKIWNYLAYYQDQIIKQNI